MSKKKNKKNKNNTNNYEGYSYGPFRLERFGKKVLMSSNWEPEQFEQYVESIRNNRPKLKKEINKKIEKILSLIKKSEPLELLATVSIKNCFADPEQYRELTHEGRECYVEYAQSLILSQEHKTGVKNATKGAIEQFNSLIEELFNDVLWYFISEFTEGTRTKIEEELRFMSILRYMFVRGDSYPEHHLEMIKDIFKDHDTFLKNHYGFNSCEIISVIQHIEEQLLNNMDQQTEIMLLLRELHELFKEFVDNEGVNSFSSLEDCRKRYFALPAVQEKKKRLDKLQNNIKENLFEVAPNKKVPIELLKLLSSKFGDNMKFIEFKPSPGWPLNDSIIYDLPIIEDNGKFYCFAYQILFRNIGNILESWIRKKDSNYYQNIYQKKRANYLENKALKYLKNILPEAKVYGKLFYNIEENGKINRVETDGLILYDDNLFIIETKAGTLSTSARRGSLKRIKRNITELIDNAYNQALRTKEYIVKTPKPTFEYKNGYKAIVIKNKDKYRNIYLINITLQNLGVISTHLNYLKGLNLIQGKEWPWSVFINDLRVISEIIEFPSVFLYFLQQRIRANDYPQFRSMDELDFLMFYFYEGLYFKDSVLQNIDIYIPRGYTEDLDRYYDFIAGRVSSGEKPKLKIPKEYKELITNIESTGKYGFTKVTTTLLSFDLESKKELLNSLNKAINKSQKEDKDYDVIMGFGEDKMGLMLSVSTNRKNDFWNKIDNYCKLKMYQTRFKEWILITVDINRDGKRALNFRIYDKKWEYDSTMEEKLNEYKKRKMAEFNRTGQKIGRNDPCPCGSGLKYKKCCGK